MSVAVGARGSSLFALGVVLSLLVVSPAAADAHEDAAIEASASGQGACSGATCVVTIACAALATGTMNTDLRYRVSTHIMACRAAEIGVEAPPVSEQGPAAATQISRVLLANDVPDSVEVCFSAYVLYQPLVDVPSAEAEDSGCEVVVLTEDPSGGFNAGESSQCSADGQDCIRATGSVVDVVVGSNPKGGAVVFACSASAPQAAGVTITTCTANSVSAPLIAYPGWVAGTAGSYTFVEEQTYMICWTAQGLFARGPIATSGCGIVTVAV